MGAVPLRDAHGSSQSGSQARQGTGRGCQETEAGQPATVGLEGLSGWDGLSSALDLLELSGEPSLVTKLPTHTVKSVFSLPTSTAKKVKIFLF